MKIQVFGTGCQKCNDLAEATKSAAANLGLDYEFEKVSDINDIIAAGVMMTPAMGVDGEVKVSGKVPSVEELESLLKA